MSTLETAMNEERAFVEIRRRVRSTDVLSPVLAHLLRGVRFTGRVSVVLQNGRILKSGYEEGYFRTRPETEPL